MRNGWTGGQYSLLRVLLGVTLGAHCGVALADAPQSMRIAFALGLAASLAFALGWQDRVAGVLLGAVVALEWAGVDAGTPLLVWLLLVHGRMPEAPYGSLAARGRADPGGGWRCPPALFRLSWIVLATYAFVLGCARLGGREWGATWTYPVLALELGFAPLALVPRARPVAWACFTLAHLALLARGDAPALASAPVLLACACFDPGWVPARASGALRVYYDGACGLCQRWVRFALAEDRAERMRFAPLGGLTFAREVAAGAGALPDSFVVRTEEGTLLVRSQAMLVLMQTLGGVWRVLAIVAGCVPKGWRDGVYDGVARVRKRVFAAPKSACPLGPVEVTRRFDA